MLPDHEKAIFEVFKPGQRPGGTLIDVPGSSARTSDDDEIAIPGLFRHAWRAQPAICRPCNLCGGALGMAGTFSEPVYHAS